MLNHRSITVAAGTVALAAVVAGLLLWDSVVHSSPDATVMPDITVSIGSGSGDVSDDVIVPLEALGVPEDPGAGAITVDVRYDPGVVDATTWDKDPNDEFDMALCNKSDGDGVDPDIVTCAYTSAAGTGGDLLLANLTFHCIANNGTSPLDVVILTFTDPNGIPFDPPPVDQDGSITCGDEMATLTVEKAVVNDDGGTATASDFTLRIDGDPVTDGVANSVNAGAHNVTEDDPSPGYTSSIGGDCASDGSVTLALGDEKTCTITNDDVAPILTVEKVVVNDNGGSDTVSDFTLRIDGDSVISGEPNTLAAGAYTVSEDDPSPGYSSSIGGDCAPDGSITLDLAEEATCIITNDDVAPTLTVAKVVVNDDGGTAGVGDFTLRIDGSPVTSSATNTVTPGPHSVSEDDPSPDYTFTIGGDCAPDGSVTVALGENKTCTITNDDVPPTPTPTPTPTLTPTPIPTALAESVEPTPTPTLAALGEARGPTELPTTGSAGHETGSGLAHWLVVSAVAAVGALLVAHLLISAWRRRRAE